MSEAAKDLELEEEEVMPEEVPVLDDSDAEYLLTRIRQANEQYEKMAAWYAHMTEKAAEVRDRTVQWAERNLRTYFASVPTKKTKTQMSYELPSGKLVLKHQEPKYETKDEELVPWLKRNQMNSLVKVKESADWANLKKELKLSPDGKAMVTADGEVVPGVTVTERDDKFVVTLK